MSLPAALLAVILLVDSGGAQPSAADSASNDGTTHPGTISRIVRPPLNFLDRRGWFARAGLARARKDRARGIGPILRLGGLSGPGAGVSVSRDSLIVQRLRVRVRLSSTLRGGHSASLDSKLATGADADIGAEATIGYWDERYVRYFGLGPISRGEDEAFYRQNISWVGLVGRKWLGPASTAAVDLILSGVESQRSGTQESPPLESRFSGSLPPGYGDRSVGAEVGLSLTIGAGRESIRSPPADLGFARAAVFRSIDGSRASFLGSRMEIQGSARIGHSGGFIAARGLVHYLDPLGSDPVPFPRLPSNSGPDLLRGYQDTRWRDRGIALGNVEFHWGVWESADPLGPALDAYLLADVGQVFGEPRGVALGNTRLSTGAGLRLIDARGFASLIEFAGSREEWILRLRTDRIFQSPRGENFRGTNTIRGI